MKTIFLIGFMGSGKSTAGRLLGNTLELPLIDMDEEIVREEGMSINQLFEEQGEEYFRELETGLLQRIPDNGWIVSTGGGVILREENRTIMMKKGIVIYLEATAGELLVRLKEDTSRPLLAENKEKEITDRLGQRLEIYRNAADFTILTDAKSPEKIVGEILACLKDAL
ncbi:shikimate kinase [Bacillus sp. B-jedd]|uniref:shikimate kinase n=1 Tax=Bacillus sp. B-jedd TaxID=1476857 RepID=UPI0005155732|nr:shikimate kinase [Bacillus sp. B-jedd]CEG27842.1 shikimate kinase [Bacillus sp. B-jedd]